MGIENVQFDLRINSGNAALVDDPNAEIARMLRHIATGLDMGEEPHMIFDLNGNPVGTASLYIEYDDDE